jgi:hypothetical protein
LTTRDLIHFRKKIKKKAPGDWSPGAECMSVIKQAQAEGTLPDNSAYPQEVPFLTLSMFIIPRLLILTKR